MLVVISPAKKLDFNTEVSASIPHTRPVMLDSAVELVGVAKKMSRRTLADLMNLSDKLAEENHRRFQDFSTPFNKRNARQAALAFVGDTFLGLDAGSLSDEERQYAQAHLRILSGLYGVLRPLDLIQPYRLEMGAKLKSPRGKSLYDFWGEQVTGEINRALARSGSSCVLNCASNEYVKVLRAGQLQAQIINPVFKQVKNGEARMLGMMAKRARGALARFVIQNQVRDPGDLKAFKADGYRFKPGLSDAGHYEFHRKA